MKKMVLSVIATVFMVLGLTGVAAVSPAYASTSGTGTGTGTGTGGTGDCVPSPGNLDCAQVDGYTEKDLMGTLKTILNVVVGFVGFIAVAVLVMGGITYAMSQGDAQKTKKAQNTILYGVVGLVVALLAYAIIQFVLDNFIS